MNKISNPMNGRDSRPRKEPINTMLVAAVIGLIAFLALVMIENGSLDFLGNLIRMALEACVIASAAVVFSQTPVGRDYFEQRLEALIENSADQTQSRLAAVISTDFVKKGTDVAFLRTLSLPTLRTLHTSLQKATFPGDLPFNVQALFDRLQSTRDQLMIWRTDLEITLTYEEYPAQPTMYQLQSYCRATLRNFSGSSQTFDQKMVEICHPEGAIPRDQYYDALSCDLAGEDLLRGARPTVSEDDGKLIFENSFSVTLPPDDGSNRWVLSHSARSLNPKTHPWVLGFFRPCHKLSITIEHPPSITPSLYVFGVAAADEDTDPLKPFVPPTPTLHRWVFDGWFMPNDGAIMPFAPRKEILVGDNARRAS
jgi:hypothetical protein